MPDHNRTRHANGQHTVERSYWSSTYQRWNVQPLQIVEVPNCDVVRSTQVGNKTANFHNSKLRPRPLPFHKFSRDLLIANGTRGAISYVTPSYREIIRGAISGYESPPMAPPDKIKTAFHNTRVGLLNQIKGMKINLAQVYAERNQTAKLVGNTAIKAALMIEPNTDKLIATLNGKGVSTSSTKKLRDRVDIARREMDRSGLLDSLKRKGKTLSNLGLAIQYGVRPLLGDVYGAAETLAKSELNLPPDVHFRESRTVGYETNSDTQVSEGVIMRRYSGKLRVKAQVTCVIDGAFSVASGLGLLNPALIAWELMPWSFVVDWFYGIGGWVNSWDATVGATFKGGGYTVLDKAQGQTTKLFNKSPYSGMTSNSSTRVVYYRDPMSSFPTPSFPPYKDTSSLEHMFNGLLLLTSAVSKR